MLANRVKETSTTTGTGNLTLAGAATNFQSFNAAFGTDRRFIYFVVDDTNNAWEHGIGYLSTSTTLVREKIINSSSANAAVNFSAGTKSIFCAPGLDAFQPGRPSQFPANHIVSSVHASVTQPVNYTITADRIYYVPFLVDFYQPIDAIVTGMQTAAGSKCRLGIYGLAANNQPGDLIVQTADITQASSSVIEGPISSTLLPPGWYYLAFVSDGADTVKADDYRYITGNPLGVRDIFFISGYTMLYEAAASWATLPAAAGSMTLSDAFNIPRLLLRIA